MIDQREDEFTKSSTSTYYRAEIISKASPSSSTTTSWSKLKDPRIVRVSRSSGGKDRHSKVYTVRGLRDRRIRLSVPTAIQLYDLQERLGLNQPSKVVDWLLNVAKNEIDTLPPLQFPQESLVSDNLRPMLTCRGASFGEENTQEHQGAYASPYNSVLKRDLNSDLSLSHDPNNSDLHNFGLVPLPSTFSVPSGSNQALMYHQPGLSTQSYFHPQINSIDQELVQRQIHFLSSSNVSPFTSSIMPTTQPIRPLPFNISTANLFLHSQNNSDQNKGFHI